MGTIRITAQSIDELNFIYRKIKKEYIPLDSIKINQETREYEMLLQKNELDHSLKAICDKVMECDELMDGGSIFTSFSWSRFTAELDAPKVQVQCRALKAVWNELSEGKKRACFQYLCEELGLSPKEDSFNGKLVA